MKINSFFSLISLIFFFLCINVLFGAISSGFASEPGWVFQVTASEDWKRVEGSGTLSVDRERLSASLVENSTTVWVLTTEPVWVYRYPLLKLRYRSRGIANDSNHPILQLQPGSTGPVTPGAANLENPFARAGSMPVHLPAGHEDNDQVHELLLTVYPPIRTEQFDRIVLTLQSGQQPAELEILELAFYEAEDLSPSAISLQNLQNLQNLLDSPLREGLSTFALPEGNVELAEVADGFQEFATSGHCAEIPFQIHDSQRVLSTSMPYRGAIVLDIHQSCREVFLLMACDLVGTDSGFGFQPRKRITQPERLIVQLNYADGSQEQSFPYNLNQSGYVVEASAACCYAIPVQASKELESVRIEETMSYGRLFLLAATLNTGEKVRTSYPVVRYPRSLDPPKTTIDAQPATLVIEENRLIRIENHFYRIDLEADRGCRMVSMVHKQAGREILQQPCGLFSIQMDGLRVEPENIRFQTYNASANSLELIYSISSDNAELLANLTIQPATGAECIFSLRLENVGKDSPSIRLRFPSLSGIQISEKIEDDFYLFPRKRAAWSNVPVRLSGVHSGEFPLQFIDLYSETLSCGVALHTRDSQMVLKQFLLEKEESQTRMGIDYGFHHAVKLLPSAVFSTPPTALQFHGGDWHVPFHTYREWCKTWYRPNPQAREVLSDVFLCRRDYPIGGTGYLFDPMMNSYTFPRLIDESREDFGGIDMIDISGWAYSEEYGRVGEYERYELGGLPNFREGVAESHDRQVPVGLYTEGYLLDPRSTIGRQNAEKWRIIDSDGKPKQWPGNQEIFICPMVADWQSFISNTLLRVANDTGVDAVYMDQYGFGDAAKTCYADNHGHPVGNHPVLAEQQMLKIVRAKLDESSRPIALYTEQIPNDISSQYVDAAFDYAFDGVRPYDSPAKINLFRFAFPSFKVIQLFHSGIDPRAASEEDAKLCFFYGEGMWLKGRARSWFSRECRAFIAKAHRIFLNHKTAFHSMDVEPMIPTAQAGLYANRFNGPDESIVTLYNETPTTLQGVLFSVPTRDVEVTDLWNGNSVPRKVEGSALQIVGMIHPHAVSCYSIRSLSK